MRKKQKEQADKFLKLLEQAHSRIRELVEKHDVENALLLLQDCQEGIIALGTMIEKSEGEGFETVAMLEEYCESVYQIYDKLAKGESAGAGNLYKILKRQLIKISGSVNKIPVRKEIVFVPYKASMWDSMESVWRAADADPECDACVVPIPYYDKNPDGSFREQHYEGDLYPKDVPVIGYSDYDFEERRPDVVVCHNPYDEYNYVTSVDPFFYTKNLKQYTDKLVYIPYFVLNEVDPDNKAAVDNMAHFVTVPGVMNADVVIVQSEKMRQVYIDVMAGYAGERTRGVWEKKILGLGSPKFDKAVSARADDGDIPQEWKEIIYRRDGSRKKIILYNTGVSALLKNTEHYLDKMRDVFAVFREMKEDVALLWRPHPLIGATISSMRPRLWEDYQCLTREYRNAGWGIYDDSAELERAIALSDAYYGDGSSVVELYRAVGKPALIQNVNILSCVES